MYNIVIVLLNKDAMRLDIVKLSLAGQIIYNKLRTLENFNLILYILYDTKYTNDFQKELLVILGNTFLAKFIFVSDTSVSSHLVSTTHSSGSIS